MKHSMEFNLPKDEYALDLHINIAQYIRAIFDIKQVIAKYGMMGHTAPKF